MAVTVRAHFWICYSIPLVYMSLFVPGPCSFCYHYSVVQFEVRYYDTSSTALLFRITLAIRGLLCFQMNFRTDNSISVKNNIGFWWGLHWICRLLLVVQPTITFELAKRSLFYDTLVIFNSKFLKSMPSSLRATVQVFSFLVYQLSSSSIHYLKVEYGSLSINMEWSVFSFNSVSFSSWF
jgi:hypothetical protein